MSAQIMDGRALAQEVKVEVANAVSELDYRPGLATVLVGDDPASHTYVRGKRRDAEQVGINSIHHELPRDVAQDTLESLVIELSADPEVDGILVQLPLPPGLDSEKVISLIDPAKDVDGLHPFNLGLLTLDRPGLRPCTPSGVLRLLRRYEVPITGARVVIVGRSFLVGRPLSLMLAARGVDATVTMAHSRTADLPSVTREADILVAAAGVPGLITDRHVKDGAAVIDVGITRTDEGLAGDVDSGPVAEVAGWITPVPGGVGPMTRAMLLDNTLQAAQARRGPQPGLASDLSG
ncbi:MAG: bifunctional methylenetetrahydrofolate dehydrogenase/methenyltetrahydrofolate cyclohydrolase FolD [Acidimicrobiia bacterium]